MFSSCVSIDESFSPVACTTELRPTSTDCSCVTATISCACTGYGKRHWNPASVVWLYLPKVLITARWPSCTMKKPLPSQISKATPPISPAPMPALLMSGWKGPPPPPPPAPPRSSSRRLALPLPPNRPLNLRLKSRHSSSRSGGPSLRLLKTSARSAAPVAPSRAEKVTGSSWSRMLVRLWVMVRRRRGSGAAVGQRGRWGGGRRVQVGERRFRDRLPQALGAPGRCAR